MHQMMPFKWKIMLMMFSLILMMFNVMNHISCIPKNKKQQNNWSTKKQNSKW